MSVDRDEFLQEPASNTPEVFNGRPRALDEDKSLELSILEEVFKKFDAIKNQLHLYELAEMVVENRVENREVNALERLKCKVRPIFNPEFNTVDEYLNAHKEAWAAKTNKYQEILKDCQANIADIISDIDSYWDVGLIGFYKAIIHFIDGKVSNQIDGKVSNQGVFFQLSKDLLKSCKVAINVLAKSYPYEYRFKRNLPIDDTLPYILCGC
ncbi:MAG: hypothetical protein LBI30_00535 [Holosporales bacterium]|jgi:hypothetical protein|nr:hypothetical protein [Holosporales bacterium]